MTTRRRFEPFRSGRGTGAYEFFELALTQGPAAIGDTGQGRLLDYIGFAWLLVMGLDRQLHLYRQADVGDWFEVTTNLPPVFNEPLPEGARRVSIAFDQSARAMVAYELDDIVRVTRWDATISQYVQNPNVAGHDPRVIFDAVWAYNIPDSDVLLFYLSPDRERVLCRVQRELYLTERLIYDFGRPVVLDQAVRLPLRYQLLLAEEDGEPIEALDVRQALVSDPYPYLGEDELPVLVAPSPDAVYAEQAIDYGASEELAALVVPGDAEYVATTVDVAASEELSALVEPSDAVYIAQALDASGDEAVDALVVPLDEAEYVRVAIDVSDGDDMTASVAPLGVAVYQEV